MKPIIGITTYGKNDYKIPSKHYTGYYVTPDAYVEAVRKAGGVPILIPAGEEDITPILDLVDGIIVSGGGDIRPEAYGGDSNHPHLDRLGVERDNLEITIIQAMAERKDKPVLCICRGMQIMNVALGGTMYEHIADIRETDTHRNEDGFWTIHEVNIDTDSKVAKAMGTNTVHTYSGHHQAVKNIAEGLKVVAKSPDNIVEGLESISHPWMIGVQWHPEKSAQEDISQQRLFDTLVALAQTKIRDASKA